jgi:hypothetical protein
MFERPAKSDIDRELSFLMHETRQEGAAECNRIKGEAAKHGALQSNRVIVTVADAVNRIHAAKLKQATELLRHFAERMEETPKQITEWARPHLENLGNVALGQIPANGFPTDHQRIIRQYRMVFQQRLDGALRAVEIGFVRGVGFSPVASNPATPTVKSEILKLTPTFWGMGIDLKAAARLLRQKWPSWLRGR